MFVKFTNNTFPDNYYHLLIDYGLPLFSLLYKRGALDQDFSLHLISPLADRFERFGHLLEIIFPEKTCLFISKNASTKTDKALLAEAKKNIELSTWRAYSEWICSKVVTQTKPKNCVLIKRSQLPRDRSIADGRPHVRFISNFDEVAAAAESFAKRESLDFYCIQNENLTFQEQVQIYANAECIIGMHGAGLTNALWMRPKTRLIEIQTTDRLGTFRSIARNLNLNYSEFMPELVGAHMVPNATLKEVGRDQIVKIPINRFRAELESGPQFSPS